MAGSNDRAQPPKTVTVDSLSLETNFCVVVDGGGQRHKVPLAVQRTGIRPQVGDTWIVDRTYGGWTLAARVRAAVTPVVSGTRADLPEALTTLLDALVQLGLVDDQTTTPEPTEEPVEPVEEDEQEDAGQDA